VDALHYFAFGSNLHGARIAARAPSARALGPARLAGYRLCADKLSSDGSGKLNLARDAAASVWGVAFRITLEDLASLEGFEPGYRRIGVSVELRRGGALAATTFLSEHRAPGLLLLPWYRELVISGAREHALPGEWIERLERLPVAPG
jgi:hypothetical protein